MDKRWYVIQVQTGFEKKICETLPKILREKGFDVLNEDFFLPIEEVIEIHNGKRVVSERFLYPSYLFFHTIMTENIQKVIIRTPRVIGLIGKPYEPNVISDSEIENIKSGIERSKDTPKLAVTFGIGERVKVKSGAFLNFSGVVDSVDESKARLKIMVSIFGRSTLLELDYDHVEKI